jgi:glycosyltransferase involved in cell wall biosynthesis
MRDELVARAQALGIWDRVRFTGPLEGEAKEAAYACASVVALPSRSEGQSITLLEALARAKPVVCTEACAFEAAVQDFAEVVPAERRALADGLLRTLRGLESARGRAVAGQRFVCETYSLERVAAAAERIYFEAFGQAGP